MCAICGEPLGSDVPLVRLLSGEWAHKPCNEAEQAAVDAAVQRDTHEQPAKGHPVRDLMILGLIIFMLAIMHISLTLQTTVMVIGVFAHFFGYFSWWERKL